MALCRLHTKIGLSSWDDAFNLYSHQFSLVRTCDVVLEHPSTSVVMNSWSEPSDIIKKAYLHLVFSDNSHSQG